MSSTFCGNRGGSRVSIVIPAHNEATLIGNTLRRILADASPGEFDVIVVCNGCTDDTGEIARSFPGVRVLETHVSSKAFALNLGDDAAKAFPRIYLDADIEVDTKSLRAVISALEAGALASGPVPIVDLSGAGLGSRAYFTVWRRLGYIRSHTLGSGFYALSRAGRMRFGRFPELMAEDLFVYSLFTKDERVNPPNSTFVIHVPMSLKATFKRRVRIAYSILELSAWHDAKPDVPGPGLLGVVLRRPWLLPAGIVYATVNMVARHRARGQRRDGAVMTWYRDESRRR